MVCTIKKVSFILLAAMAMNLSSFAQQPANSSALNTIRNDADGSIKSISFSPAASLKQEQAQDIFSNYYGITPTSEIEMRFVNSTTTKQNTTTKRYAQYYKGINVAYSSITLTGKGDGVSFGTSNFYPPDNDLSSTPSLTEAVAFTKAIAFVGADKYKWENPIEEEFIKRETNNPDTSFLPKGKLVWVEDLFNGNKDHKLHLAYSFDIYADEPMSRQEVFVDATTGNILFSNQLIKHTAATGLSAYSGVVPFQTSFVGGTYRLYDSTRGSGVYTRNMNNGTSYGAAIQFTSATNTWPPVLADDVALDAHWGGEVVYDFLNTQLGRLSWDGADGILLQYVHYSNNYNNAYWNGSSMTYGDGTGIAAGGFSPLTSLDVTAHEIGHGICQATCNLVYASESGALNEAFSDCWGATIENWANPHEVDAMPKEPWDIGEEIGTEPLRSMSAPLLQGQPDTYGGTNWFNVVGCTPSGGNDQCGVHRNSGLMNYWYYLLVLGGTGTNDIGNSYIVNALGWTKAATILYQTELVLSSTATYMDCRIASINAANTIFGACSFEAQCVTSAWYAVGVGPNFVPCTPQIAFETPLVNVMETAPSVACGASKTINIGLTPIGPTIAGGSPVVNLVVAAGSTAVAGVDYTLSSSSVVFPMGSTATQYVTMTIFDNGNVNDDKTLKLAYTVSPMGSGAVIAPFNDSMTINIYNDDSVPHLGARIYPELNEGIPVESNFTSPFYGTRVRARSQYLLYASELAKAGVVPRVPMTQIALNVLTKTSTAPFINFTVSMANTANNDLYSGFVGGLTQVYLGDHTTNLGVDSIDFNTGTFTWDGTSNVVVQFCYGRNAAAFSTNDRVEGVQQGAFIIGGYNTNTGGTGTGCSLGFSTGNRTVVRPVVRFKQDVPPTTIETVAGSNRVWNVLSGQEVYFYTPADTQVIAGIKDMDNSLGCVTATVSQQGNGMVPATFSAINRSRKEITITPTTNGSITTYDVTFYMNNTELAGVTPSTLSLIRTTAPTDATLSSGNTTVLSPTLIAGGNYTGFRGTFTGFGRYMLIDGPLCNKPNASATAAGPTSFCVGSNVVINATPTGPLFGYQWMRDGIDIVGATTSSYTASLGGDYRVRVNETACDSVSLPITVILDSAHTEPITGASSGCIGTTTLLSSTTTGGVWTSTNIAVANISSTGTVTHVGAGTTTISYSVTNACGTATATYIITTNAATALPSITGSPSVCEGSAETLSNTTLGGMWSSSNPAVATIGSSGIVTGLSAGTTEISYIYTNAFGCVSNVTTIETVNATPVTTTSPAGTFVICSGTTFTIDASPASGHTYMWTDGGVSIPTATGASYTTSAPGLYQVTATNAFGCFSTSAIVDISINPSPVVIPSVSISSSSGLSICASASPVLFTATPVNGGFTPTYQWYVNSVATGGTGGTLSYAPANGDVVSVLLTSSESCATPLTATTSVTMTVSPYATPSVTVNASPDDTVCIGESVTYTPVAIWGGASPTYTWSQNGISVATGASYTTIPLNGDIIVCTMTSDYVCRLATTVSSPLFTMHVKEPVLNFVNISTATPVALAGASVTFAAIAPNAGASATYQWFINSIPVPGATNITFVTSSLSNGDFVHCKVNGSNACVDPIIALSNGITMTIINSGTSIGETGSNNDKLVAIPNPTSGVFTISGSAGYTAGAEIKITVVNMLGQEVYTKNVQTPNGLINETITLPNNTAAGIYLVSVTSATQRAVMHLTVQK